MKILLVRHGKTKGNTEKRYVGRTDEPLHPDFLDILEDSPYREFNPDILYSSPMKRTIETASILFPDHPIITVDNLRETDFGDFEYKTFAELNGNPDYQAWIDSNGKGVIPNGENGAAFQKRSIDAFENCINDAKDKGADSIAVVCHGGTIMAIMSKYGNDKSGFYSYMPDNGGGYIIEL